MIIKSLPVIGSVIYGSKRPINEMFVSIHTSYTECPANFLLHIEESERMRSSLPPSVSRIKIRSGI